MTGTLLWTLAVFAMMIALLAFSAWWDRRQASAAGVVRRGGDGEGEWVDTKTHRFTLGAGSVLPNGRPGAGRYVDVTAPRDHRVLFEAWLGQDCDDVGSREYALSEWTESDWARAHPSESCAATIVVSERVGDMS